MGGNSAWRDRRAHAAPKPLAHNDSQDVLCSAATPPGGGVHGMAGYYAARSLLRREFGLDMPRLAP
ncbi:NAD(P)/FAD-dependent oxidoreductase [Mycobacterium ahvazicum]|uniref:NAD(P)/FAD-dependent oxidoreductase n=1 Tax=Mycobacterium ahvazicum TaxID=1964395 RepID=A0A2K4Y855_9MYCO|nr:NAD(P)/FAD-dependent oxidoreductase [Mycobacterium ahvazicum]